MSLLAEGLPQKAVAARLGVSQRAIEERVFRARIRIGARDCTELIRMWNLLLASERSGS